MIGRITEWTAEGGRGPRLSVLILSFILYMKSIIPVEAVILAVVASTGSYTVSATRAFASQQSVLSRIQQVFRREGVITQTELAAGGAAALTVVLITAGAFGLVSGRVIVTSVGVTVVSVFMWMVLELINNYGSIPNVRYHE